MNIKNRGEANKCLVCGGSTRKQTTLTSKFLSTRAWGGDVEWSDTSKCLECGFTFHGRGLSTEEVESYYKSYRDEKYFKDRNACEPFYTRKVHDEHEKWKGSKDRRLALSKFFSKHNILVDNINNLSILDYAGGTGRLIADMPGIKNVFDVSGEQSALGVEKLSSIDLNLKLFDLVVCAQVIEHVTDPKGVAEYLYGLVKPGGYLYVEVPCQETWRDFSCSGKLRDTLLAFAKTSSWFNVALDIYGTAFRVKLKILPPFAFVPVREHLNYFTPESMSALGKAIGAIVINASPLLLKKPL
jgi:SAM-dependent methyltransferase